MEDSELTAAKVHLVNASGQEKVWLNGELVDASSSGTNPYGKMTVQITELTNVSKYNGTTWIEFSTLSAAEKASLAGTYTFDIDGYGRSHVMAAIPTGDAFLTDTDVTVSAALSAAGVISSNSAAEFYYTVDGQKADSETQATGDGPAGTTGTAVQVKVQANHKAFTPLGAGE